MRPRIIVQPQCALKWQEAVLLVPLSRLPQHLADSARRGALVTSVTWNDCGLLCTRVRQLLVNESCETAGTVTPKSNE